MGTTRRPELDPRGRSEVVRPALRGPQCSGLGRAAAAVAALLLLTAPLPAGGATQEGWLYIHKYLNDKQRDLRGGIATAPFFVFSESGALIGSGSADGTQPPGKLIPVPAGTYYVAAGRFNLGLTRQRYQVKPGKVTVIQTGFVMIETWPQQDQPRQGCSPWDAEMTLYGTKDGMLVPIFSNSRLQYGTKHFGMIQMLTGSYRLGWHGFDLPVDIRAGQIYRVPLGTVGPLADPKGRVSRTREETSDSMALRLCDDGPTHVLAGQYWVSYAKPLEEYPYEERVWQQVDVPPLNEPGYDAKKLTGERLGKPLLTGPEAEPVAAATEMDGVIGSGKAAATAPTEQDPLGGEILWDSPP